MSVDQGAFIARVQRFGIGAVLLAGLVAWIGWGSSAAVSLTAAGAVATITIRWLACVMARVVQPGSPRVEGKSMALYGLRLMLLAGLVAAVRWLPEVKPVAVLVGFTIPLCILVREGLASQF